MRNGLRRDGQDSSNKLSHYAREKVNVVRPKYKPAGRFSKRFAKIGFATGGLVMFCFGFQAFYQPEPPTGFGICGGVVLAGLCIMVVIAPLAGLVGALAGWLIGSILDRNRDPDC